MKEAFVKYKLFITGVCAQHWVITLKKCTRSNAGIPEMTDADP